MARPRSLVALLAALAVCAAVPAAAARPSTAAAHPLAVTAFQTQGSRPALIDRSARAITTVGVDGVVLRRGGGHVTNIADGAFRQLERAHQLHKRAELLVSNYSDAIQDFSEPLAHALLANPRHRAAVARQLLRDVTRHGFDGVSIDIEALHGRDRVGLTAFTRLLHRLLPRTATLSICVSGYPHTGWYAPDGYALRALGRATDRVVLMTYDEHGPWENKPGPVGALTWQRACVRAARHFVPAGHMDLGVAGYGYGWRPHRNVTLSDARARALAGAAARWNPTVGEWTATLHDGSTLWWSDHRSYLTRLALARRLGMHGVAVWDLQYSDPLT